MKKSILFICFCFAITFLYSDGIDIDKTNSIAKTVLSKFNNQGEYINGEIKAPGTFSGPFFTGLVSPNNLIWGLTDFLLNRAKEEMIQSIIKDLVAWLDEDENKPYKLIFPDTTGILPSLSMLSYKSIIPTVRAAIIKDLQNLPVNIRDSGVLDMIKLNISEDVKYIIKQVLTLIIEIKAGGNPEKAIFDCLFEIADKIYELSGEKADINKCNIVKVIVCAFYLDFNKMMLVITKPESLGQFLEILAVKLSIEPADISEIKEYLIKIVDFFNTITKIYERIRKIDADNSPNLVLDYIKFVRAVILIVREYLAYIQPEQKEMVFEILDDYAALVSALLEENYNLVIIQVIDLINAAYLPHTIKSASFEKDILNRIENENHKEFIKKNYELNKEKNEYALESGLNYAERKKILAILKECGYYVIPEKMVKLLIFMSNLAMAKTSEEVSGVIEAAAAPVGSYKVKRETQCALTMSLNSYLGFTGGLSMGLDSDISYWYVGPTLPLGVEFSWCLYKDALSLGIFLSVLDLGSLVQYAISTEEVSAYPEVDFTTVFVPGAAFVCGITDYPITIGLMTQYAPVRREITGSGTLKYEFRISLFIACDLLLLRF